MIHSNYSHSRKAAHPHLIYASQPYYAARTTSCAQKKYHSTHSDIRTYLFALRRFTGVISLSRVSKCLPTSVSRLSAMANTKKLREVSGSRCLKTKACVSKTKLMYHEDSPQQVVFISHAMSCLATMPCRVNDVHIPCHVSSHIPCHV